MRHHFHRLTLILAALASTPAHAKVWPDAGGWHISEGDTSCLLSSSFEGNGETDLTVGLNIDNSVFVMVINDDWSTEKGEIYDIKWMLNGYVYSGASVGIEALSKKGFGKKFRADFLDDFAKSSGLLLSRNGKTIDNLDLKGSGLAIAAVRKCFEHVKALAAAEDRERQRLSHIPADPFAGGRSAAEVEKYGGSQVAPIGDEGSWVSPEDYPSAARREGRGGVVGVRLQVGKDGRAESCDITTSSGHDDLDKLTCQLLIRRARFRPSSSGGIYEKTVRWKL